MPAAGQLISRGLGYATRYAMRHAFSSKRRRLNPRESVPRAGNAIAQAQRFRGLGSNTSTYRQISTAYRKRPMGRRQRRDLRLAKQFKRTWSKVQGLKSMTLTNRVQAISAVDTQNIVGVVALNGVNDTTGADNGFGDIPAIAAVVHGAVGTSGAKQRFMINKIVLDIWIKNISENLAFVDLYEYVLRKDLEADLGITLSTVFLNIYNNTTTVRGTQEVMTDLGWSPFEISEICKRFLILKVHRLQIPAGQNFSFHRIYKRPYTPSVNDLNDGGGLGFTGRKGHFRGFFCRIAGDQTGLVHAQATTVSFLARRTYYYSTLFDSYNDQGKVNPLVP